MQFKNPSYHFVILLWMTLLSVPIDADDWENQERIEVTAEAPPYQSTLAAVLPQQQILDGNSISTDSLATLFSQAPAINLNGQGGLFQTFNIRGFARWRIKTEVEGIPIHTDRRAGSAVEFLPPNFLGRADLTQGAASTQLGSGAMGGGLNLGLSFPQEHLFKLSYGHQQDYRDIFLQGITKQNGDTETLSWLFNHRHGNNSEDPESNSIQDKFEQHSFMLRTKSGTKPWQDGFLFYSEANNIAKASSDLPEERSTLYPRNKHLLGKVKFDWYNATVYLHDSSLQTVVTRPAQRINSIINESLDVGIRAHDNSNYGDILFSWRAGFDSRNGVTVFEREVDSDLVESFARKNLDARQWEAYLALDANKPFSNGNLVAGGRLARQYQRDTLANQPKSDNNLSAFLGYAQHFSKSWKLAGYISSAYRVPSLTERFFNGSTPRGTVIGDSDLKTETARNAELSLSYSNSLTNASISVFHQSIVDYIERVTIDDTLRRYQNVDNAKIRGLNYQLQHQFETQDWSIKFVLGGQWLKGENNNGVRIADIPPAKHRLQMSVTDGRKSGFLTLSHRQSSDEIISGEQATKDVTTIDVGVSMSINDQADLSINFTNLSNEKFLTSRDDLAPFAKGRDVNLSLQYRF